MLLSTNIPRPSAMAILGIDLEPLGIVENYTTLTLKPSFFGIGSFEMSVPATPQLKALLDVNLLIDFGLEGELVGIIEGIAINLTSLGARLRIYGPMLDGIMRRRVVVPSDDKELLGWDVAEGTVGRIMAHYVTDHAITPIQPTRSFPLLKLAHNIDDVGMDTVAKARFGLVSDTIQSVAQFASVGWRIIIAGDHYEFEALDPVDRTENSENPLVLSTMFKNIKTADTELDKTDFANTVYALGDGEYENRLHQVFYTDDVPVAGWDRFETVADCGNEPSIARLREIALQKIADLEQTQSLMLQLNSLSSDAHLGDFITIYLPEINAFYDLIISEMTITWQGSTTQVGLTLGRPPRTLVSQLQRARKLSNIK